jgi:pimeloyl-ACP methyl ester carboxylesterase
MGGTVALMFAAQEPQVAALVTIAAPLHPENFPKRILTPAQIQKWRELGFTTYHGQRLNAALLDDLEQLDVVESARRIGCPVLILHGDADDVVPVAEAYELAACLSTTKRLEIFKDTDHRLSDSAVMQRAMAAALAWLVEHVR